MNKPVLDGLSQEPVTAAPVRLKRNAPAYGWAICPECMEEFERHYGGQLFCKTQHRRDWNNRATVRGAMLAPLSMVARITRNGTRGTPEEREVGKRASSNHNRLIQKWRDEDKVKKRMPWARYLILRYAAGFDPI